MGLQRSKTFRNTNVLPDRARELDLGEANAFWTLCWQFRISRTLFPQFVGNTQKGIVGSRGSRTIGKRSTRLFFDDDKTMTGSPFVKQTFVGRFSLHNLSHVGTVRDKPDQLRSRAYRTRSWASCNIGCLGDREGESKFSKKSFLEYLKWH